MGQEMSCEDEVRSRNNYLLQYVLKANYDHQEMRYPGEPLKTLLAMLFQVSWQKTSEFFLELAKTITAMAGKNIVFHLNISDAWHGDNDNCSDHYQWERPRFSNG